MPFVLSPYVSQYPHFSYLAANTLRYATADLAGKVLSLRSLLPNLVSYVLTDGDGPWAIRVKYMEEDLCLWLDRALSALRILEGHIEDAIYKACVEEQRRKEAQQEYRQRTFSMEADFLLRGQIGEEFSFRKYFVHDIPHIPAPHPVNMYMFMPVWNFNRVSAYTEKLCQGAKDLREQANTFTVFLEDFTRAKSMWDSECGDFASIDCSHLLFPLALFPKELMGLADYLTVIAQRFDTSQLLDLMRLMVTSAISTSRKNSDIISNLMETYGFDEDTAKSLSKLQQGILKRAKDEDWSNKRIIYEYNRIVASFCPDHYVATRWSGTAGTVTKEKRDALCAEYGLSPVEIKSLNGINEQHGNSQYKDYAHEAIQLAIFTDESWRETDLTSVNGLKSTIANLLSTFGNTAYGSFNPVTDTQMLGDMEPYEASFKGDVDSGRYSDVDFNSDLDAINTYDRMLKAKTSDIFFVSADYNTQISANLINRDEEFYRTIGDGDIKKGKKNVEKILGTWTPGQAWIQHGATNDYETSLRDFHNYLKRGEEQNVAPSS